jgi:hypothetical protein
VHNVQDGRQESATGEDLRWNRRLLECHGPRIQIDPRRYGILRWTSSRAKELTEPDENKEIVTGKASRREVDDER